MPRKQMIVHGRVQGVGFRATIEQLAKQYGLTGWVKNKPDGTVEIEAEGYENELSSFIEVVRAGPNNFAKVQALDIKDLENENSYSNFKIIH
ncbi:acylphosphatase [Halobacillus shinanisalinarum]|uniref:Acylphosphatase n=1 Tax=Halobacillus shinanisalinarum TaxID=2932258 RepID=A0ABY4GZ85_9BACI|nr:acylphosphatase [Halobacillus shinanisalinarum]UOQ93506.1 acylphosphatase [Halobacillus shinanisalinarum]